MASNDEIERYVDELKAERVEELKPVQDRALTAYKTDSELTALAVTSAAQALSYKSHSNEIASSIEETAETLPKVPSITRPEFQSLIDPNPRPYVRLIDYEKRTDDSGINPQTALAVSMKLADNDTEFAKQRVDLHLKQQELAKLGIKVQSIENAERILMTNYFYSNILNSGKQLGQEFFSSNEFSALTPEQAVKVMKLFGDEKTKALVQEQEEGNSFSLHYDFMEQQYKNALAVSEGQLDLRDTNALADMAKYSAVIGALTEDSTLNYLTGAIASLANVTLNTLDDYTGEIIGGTVAAAAVGAEIGAATGAVAGGLGAVPGAIVGGLGYGLKGFLLSTGVASTYVDRAITEYGLAVELARNFPGKTPEEIYQVINEGMDWYQGINVLANIIFMGGGKVAMVGAGSAKQALKSQLAKLLGKEVVTETATTAAREATEKTATTVALNTGKDFLLNTTAGTLFSQLALGVENVTRVDAYNTFSNEQRSLGEAFWLGAKRYFLENLLVNTAMSAPASLISFSQDMYSLRHTGKAVKNLDRLNDGESAPKDQYEQAAVSAAINSQTEPDPTIPKKIYIRRLELQSALENQQIDASLVTRLRENLEQANLNLNEEIIEIDTALYSTWDESLREGLKGFITDNLKADSLNTLNDKVENTANNFGVTFNDSEVSLNERNVILNERISQGETTEKMGSGEAVEPTQDAPTQDVPTQTDATQEGTTQTADTTQTSQTEQPPKLSLTPEEQRLIDLAEQDKQTTRAINNIYTKVKSALIDVENISANEIKAVTNFIFGTVSSIAKIAGMDLDVATRQYMPEIRVEKVSRWSVNQGKFVDKNNRPYENYGSLTVKDGKAVITLYPQADGMTLIHETTHFALEMFMSFADDLNAKIKGDPNHVLTLEETNFLQAVKGFREWANIGDIPWSEFTKNRSEYERVHEAFVSQFILFQGLSKEQNQPIFNYIRKSLAGAQLNRWRAQRMNVNEDLPPVMRDGETAESFTARLTEWEERRPPVKREGETDEAFNKREAAYIKKYGPSKKGLFETQRSYQARVDAFNETLYPRQREGESLEAYQAREKEFIARNEKDVNALKEKAKQNYILTREVPKRLEGESKEAYKIRLSAFRKARDAAIKKEFMAESPYEIKREDALTQYLALSMAVASEVKSSAHNIYTFGMEDGATLTSLSRFLNQKEFNGLLARDKDLAEMAVENLCDDMLTVSFALASEEDFLRYKNYIQNLETHVKNSKQPLDMDKVKDLKEKTLATLDAYRKKRDDYAKAIGKEFQNQESDMFIIWQTTTNVYEKANAALSYFRQNQKTLEGQKLPVFKMSSLKGMNLPSEVIRKLQEKGFLARTKEEELSAYSRAEMQDLFGPKVNLNERDFYFNLAEFSPDIKKMIDIEAANQIRVEYIRERLIGEPSLIDPSLPTRLDYVNLSNTRKTLISILTNLELSIFNREYARNETQPVKTKAERQARAEARKAEAKAKEAAKKEAQLKRNADIKKARDDASFKAKAKKEEYRAKLKELEDKYDSEAERIETLYNDYYTQVRITHENYHLQVRESLEKGLPASTRKKLREAKSIVLEKKQQQFIEATGNKPLGEKETVAQRYKSLKEKLVKEKEASKKQLKKTYDEDLKAINKAKDDAINKAKVDFYSVYNKDYAPKPSKEIVTREKVASQLSKVARSVVNETKVGDLHPMKLMITSRLYFKYALQKLRKGDEFGARAHLRSAVIFSEQSVLAGEIKQRIKSRYQALTKIFSKSDATLSADYQIEELAVARGLWTFISTGKRGAFTRELAAFERYNPSQARKIKQTIQLNRDKLNTINDLDVETANAILDTIEGSLKEAKKLRQEEKSKVAEELANNIKAIADEVEEYRNAKGLNRQNSNLNIEGGSDTRAQPSLLYRFVSWTFKIERELELIDGQTDGTLKSILFKPVQNAYDTYKAKSIEYATKFNENFSSLIKVAKEAKAKRRERGVEDLETWDSGLEILIRNPDGRLSKGRLVFGAEGRYKGDPHMSIMGVLQHCGNASNMSRLCASWGITPQQLSAMLRRAINEGIITPDMMASMQKFWDMYANILNASQEAHYKAHGFYFKTVDNIEIVMPDGLGGENIYNGGYVPVSVRDRLPKVSETPDALNTQIFETFPTRDNFTKERSSFEHGLQIDTDISSVANGLVQQLLYAYVSNEALKAYRTLNSTTDATRLGRALDVIRPNFLERYNEWLSSIMLDGVPLGSENQAKIYRFFNTFIGKANASLLAWNIGNILSGTTALTTALTRAGFKPLLVGISQAMIFRMSWKDTAQMSNFMRARWDGPTKDLKAVKSRLLRNFDNIFVRGLKNLDDFAYVGQVKVMKFVDNVVWTGVFKTEFARLSKIKDMKEADAKALAIEKADSAVRTTQGSFDVVGSTQLDRSKNPFVRAFNSFLSYFIQMSNLFYADVGIGMRNNSGIKKVGSLLKTFGLVIYLPTILTSVMMMGVNGKFMGADEDEMQGLILDATVFDPLKATISITAPVLSGVGNFTINKAFDTGFRSSALLQTPAVVTILTNGITSLVKFIKAEIEDEDVEFTDRDWDNVFQLLSVYNTMSKPIYDRAKVTYKLLNDEYDTTINDIIRALITGRESNAMKE